MKIGFSRNVSRRLPEFSTGMPGHIRALIVVRGEKPDERAVHEAMWAYRRAGEWFDATQELLTFIGDCVLLDSVAAALDRLHVQRSRTKKGRTCDVRP